VRVPEDWRTDISWRTKPKLNTEVIFVYASSPSRCFQNVEIGTAAVRASGEVLDAEYQHAAFSFSYFNFDGRTGGMTSVLQRRSKPGFVRRGYEIVLDSERSVSVLPAMEERPSATCKFASVEAAFKQLGGFLDNENPDMIFSCTTHQIHTSYAKRLCPCTSIQN